MKKLEKLFDYIYEVDYSLTPTETMIVQRQRNELKYNLLEAFVEVLIDAGMPEDQIHRTTDGYIFELQNLEHGVIPIEIDVKVKNMNYDIIGAIEDWESKIRLRKEKEEKEHKAQAERERRKAERERLENQRKERIRAEYEEFKKKHERK